jgi:uncharacterized membrane protein YfcA
MMSWLDFVLVGVAAFAGGAVNALAGGGTLITFPMLTAVGIPAVAANVTNTVALCPGYLGGMLAQMKDLRDQKQRLWLFVPASIVGGIVGGLLLLNSGEKLFRSLIPYLILLASVSMAAWAVLPVGLAAVYGGYFGAGLSVIVLAVLGLTLGESLTKLNALKQAIAFSTNIAAAIFFVFSGNVNWPVAGVMAVFALAGGTLGGRLAGRIKPEMLRRVVVVIGVIVAVIYLVRK